MNALRRLSLLRFLKRSGDARTAVPRRRSSEVVRTLPVVVILTLLIWIYAERAQNRDDSVTTLLAVTTSDPKIAAALTEGADTRVTISLNGPRGQIDQLKQRIETTSVDGRLRVALPAADATIGERPVDLTRLLNDNPVFANSGVAVTKTTPSQLRVSVDPVVTREAAVVLPRDLPVTLQSFAFDPAQLTVRGPVPAINAQFGSVAPTIAIDLAAIADAAARGDRSIEVPLVATRDPRLTFSALKVKMTFEVGSIVREDKIPSVFIDIRRPSSEDGQSVVTIRGGVKYNVKIRGPANLVNRLVGDRPQSSLRAVLRVTPEDVGQGELTRALEFPDLEPGLTVVDGPYTVTFEAREVPGGRR